MKKISSNKIILTILLSSLILVTNLLCLTITKIIYSPNKISESITTYSEKTVLPTRSHIVTQKCEIVIEANESNYVNQLKQNYPNCKIIEKSQLYNFNLINQLLNFFE